MVTKTAWYRHKTVRSSNRIEDPKISPQCNRQLIFDKGAKTYIRE
jgi:hypothetical protein